MFGASGATGRHVVPLAAAAGWAIVFGGSGKPLPTTFNGSCMRLVHAVAAKLLMALIVLHVAAALWHHAVRRDGLLRRMGFGRGR